MIGSRFMMDCDTCLQFVLSRECQNQMILVDQFVSVNMKFLTSHHSATSTQLIKWIQGNLPPLQSAIPNCHDAVYHQMIQHYVIDRLKSAEFVPNNESGNSFASMTHSRHSLISNK